MAAAGLASGLPKCAQECITTTGPSSQCSQTDVKCLCGTSDYSLRLGCCFAQNCNTQDQQSAITVTQGICEAVGIKLPDFVSCNADYTSAVNAAINGASSVASSQSVSREKATTSASETVKQSTVGSIQPGVVISATTSTIVPFTGKSILTGSCTTPQFALMTVGNGFLEYPWLGCSNFLPECCPFDLRIGGQLSVCPADYTTTGTGCCPSGYSVYSSEIGGATPCVTTPILPLVPPGATNNPAVSVIRTQLFALQYSVVPKSHKGTLGTGPIAGIAVGAFAFLALLLGAATLFIRRRRRAASSIIPKSSDDNLPTEKKSPVDDAHEVDALPSPAAFFRARSQSNLVSELPSPGPSDPQSPQSILPPNPRFPADITRGLEWRKPKTPQREPGELEGDSFLHAHHPANTSPTTGDGGRQNSDDALKEAVTPQTTGFSGDAFSGSAMGGGGREGPTEGGESLESPVLGRAK